LAEFDKAVASGMDEFQAALAAAKHFSKVEVPGGAIFLFFVDLLLSLTSDSQVFQEYRTASTVQLSGSS
jgi:hypothetical protein